MSETWLPVSQIGLNPPRFSQIRVSKAGKGSQRQQPGARSLRLVSGLRGAAPRWLWFRAGRWQLRGLGVEVTAPGSGGSCWPETCRPAKNPVCVSAL